MKKMKKIHIARIAIFATTIVVVVTFATILGLYARGYRLSQEEGLTPHGLLAIKSDPSGAEVLLNGEIKTATDDNLPIKPGVYNVEVRKDGFLTWEKELKIEEETVTQVIAQLFKSAPSLNSITFTGALNPVPSRDFSKIAYTVPPEIPGTPDEKSGLWVLETINLPIGFSREPRRITNGDLTGSRITWSPNDREILLETQNGASYLLNTDTFTNVDELKPLGTTRKEVIAQWEEEIDKKREVQLNKLPDELASILGESNSPFIMSPDNDMILYTAQSTATLPENLIPPVPGASNQKQERDIKVGHTYVYDIEEDRNFLIDDNSETLSISTGETISKDVTRRLSWFPTSRNLVLAEEGYVAILDYDGTNKREVFSGNYSNPFAFSTVSDDRIILLTNFGATDTLPNLYSLNLK